MKKILLTFAISLSLYSVNTFAFIICQNFVIMPDEKFTEKLYMMSAGHCSSDLDGDNANRTIFFDHKYSQYVAAPATANTFRQNYSDWDLLINPKFELASPSIDTILKLPSDYNNIPKELIMTVTRPTHGGSETFDITVTSVSKQTDSSFGGRTNIRTERGDSGSAVYDKKTGIVYGILSGSADDFIVFTRVDIKDCFTNGDFNYKKANCKLPKQ